MATGHTHNQGWANWYTFTLHDSAERFLLLEWLYCALSAGNFRVHYFHLFIYFHLFEGTTAPAKIIMY
jgi:hypothetical protein